MITARIFEITLDGIPIDRVYFVGPEYDAETVRKFLIGNDGANKDIQVRQIKEVKR